MKSLIIIVALVMVGLVYSFPPRTVTIKFTNGTTSTATATALAGKLTVGHSYPIYKGILDAGYIVGTGHELVHIQQAEITDIKNEW